MKSKRTRIIIAATAATLIVAGLITFFVLKNKNKNKTNIETDKALASYEVSFALPQTVSDEERNTTKLPAAVTVQEGTTIGTLAQPTRDGAIFMNWTYDAQGTNRANKDDQIKSNLVLYPRFVKEQGLNDITGFTYVAKTDVPADFDIELITYGLSRAQVEELVSIKNASRGGVDVPLFLSSESEDEARKWLSDAGYNGYTIEAVLACIDKSKDVTGHDTLLDLLKELSENPTEGVELTEDGVTEIVYHFAHDAVTLENDSVYDGLDEQTLMVINALGIDFSTVTEADLLERYGLEPDDSVERYWREEIGLDVNQVLLLEQFLYSDKNLRGDHWKLHTAYGEWEGGEVYSVNLADTARIRFVYDDEPTKKEVTEYNITIAQEEVMNMTVDESVIHVPASEVQGVDFRGVLTLETDENGNMSAKENTGKGVLTYSGSKELKTGMTVAVHKGDFSDDGISSGDVAYVTIISPLENNQYEYEYSGLESIVSAENVIPVPDDGSLSDGKITVDKKYLNFENEAFKDYGLSKDSVIKVGDSLTFYTGKLGGADFKETGYGKITGVTNENNSVVLSYSLISYEEMTAPEVILYNKLEEVNFEDSTIKLEDVEKNMYEQISKSSIMDETKELFEMLLTDQDIDFDSFEHGDELRNMVIKTNGEDMTLEDIRKLSGGSSKVKVDDWQFTFTGGFILQYLEGKGLRAEVAVSFKITIQIGDNGGVLEIVPAIIFEQEIKLTPSVKVHRNKNKLGLTSSLDITASLDAGTYTGFGVVVTAQTKNEEKEDSDFATMTGGFIDNGNSDALKDRATAAKALITAGDAFKTYTNLEEMKEKGAGYSRGGGESGKQEGQDYVSPGLGGGLVEKYANMLGNDSEYIDIVDVDLASIDLPIDPCGIIHVGMKINFNVSLKINAMIGAGISYENEKLYSYAFRAKIWGGGDEFNKIGGFKEGSSVTDVKTSCFRADFYAFGMVGLRAGVSLDLRVGVFSTDLDSVGVVASAGVYAELYGFLYVHYELKAGQPAKSGACGSLYFEVGIYVEINLKVQVGAGVAKKEWPLYESTIPFVKLGCEFFPIDFSIEPDDDKLTVKIPSTTNSIKIDGDSIFTMKLMEMKSGEEVEQKCDSKKVDTTDGTFITATIKQPEQDTNGVALSTSRSWTQFNEENFTVECFDTNADGEILEGASSFQYMPGTNEIVVIPVDCTKTKFYGKIVFTYKNHAFGFNTEKIQRTVNVSWEGVLKTARVDFYREVTTLGAFELVGTGSVTGLENTYCYIAITPEFAEMYQGYRLNHMAYPDEKELSERKDSLSDQVDEARKAFLKTTAKTQEWKDTYKVWQDLLEEYQIVNSLYNGYKEQNETAVRERNGGNTYFTLRGNDTVVGAYFRRYWVLTNFMVYDTQYDSRKSRDFTTTGLELLDKDNLMDHIPGYMKNFRPELYESVNWYMKYSDPALSARYGNGALGDDMRAYQVQIRETGDLSGLTPVTEDTILDRDANNCYLLVVGIPVGIEHTIHWMDDETEIATTKQHYLEKIVPPSNPTKDGCVFEGWDGDFGRLDSETTMPNSDIYLNACFKGDDVKATWVLDDGRTFETVIHVNDRIYQSFPEELVSESEDTMIIWRSEKDNMDTTIPFDYKMNNRSEVTFYGRPGIGFSRITWIDNSTDDKYEYSEYVEIGVAPKRPELTNSDGLDLTWILSDGRAMQKEFIMPRSGVTATALWHTHEWSDETARVEPTCKTPGHEGVKCKVCGLIADGTTIPMDKNAHVWVDYIITPPTCTKEGVQGHQCDYCVAREKGYTAPVEINPYNHVNTERRNELKPSCVKGYSGDIYCVDCGELILPGYEMHQTGICVYGIHVGYVEPTCTEWGDPGKTVCRYCGTVMQAYAYKLKPTGHVGEIVPEKSKDATCEESGIRHMKCKTCDEEWDEVLAPLGHEWVEDKNVEEATCQHGAIMRFHCKNCGATEELEVSEKFDHYFEKGVVVKEATCKEEGLMRYTCKYCDETKEEPIPKTETHQYSQGVETKKATCDQKGEMTYTCQICGYQFTSEIEMTDHKWDVVGITKEPTCSETGIRTEKCINCGLTKEIVLDKDPNNHTKLTNEETVQEAGCVSEGVKRRVCEACGKTFTEKTPALGHDWGKVTYEWSTDCSTVTAIRKCKRDSSHEEKETVKTTSEVTKKPTADAMGETTYTATFKNEAFKTQTKTLTNIDKIDESWNDPTYTWSSDNSTVTAKRVRRADSSIVETETVNTKVDETKKVTCEQDGEKVYTAEFKNPAFSKQTKSETVKKLGHKWEAVSGAATEPEMILDENGCCIGWKLGKKPQKCANCGEEKSEDVKVSLAFTSTLGEVCTSYSKSAITFDLRKLEDEYGWSSVAEWAGDRTFDELVVDSTYIAAYVKESDGWWLWEGEEIDAHFDIHFALMQCHPDGSYSYTDNSLTKTKAKDFTGDKAVFTVTFTPKDTTTYTATTTTVTFLFPGQ